MTAIEELTEDLRVVLNRHGIENESATPDFVLAEYLVRCLGNWAATTGRRDGWWSFTPRVGGVVPAVDLPGSGPVPTPFDASPNA